MRNIRLKSSVFCLAVCAVLLLLGASGARADSAVVNFDIPSTVFPPPTSGPWATMTLTLGAGGVINGDLSLASGLVTNQLCFDIPGDVSGAAASGLPASWSTFANTSLTCGTVFGGYNAYFFSGNGDNDPTGTVGSLTFTLSRTSGFSSVFDMISDSAYGTSSSVPFQLEVATCPASGGDCSYGVVGGTVPEPSSLLLLGTALIGLIAFAWMIRRRPLGKGCFVAGVE